MRLALLRRKEFFILWGFFIAFTFFLAPCAQAANFGVTINKKLGQSDPSYTVPVLYTVVFASPINVSTFTTADISTAGSTATGISINSITQVAPNNGTTFEVSVSATGQGNIVLNVIAGSYTYSSTAVVWGATTNSYALAYDAAHAYIYGANNITRAIYRMDVSFSGATNIGTLPLNASPYNLAVDAAGNVYSANFGLGTVSRIDYSTNAITTFATVGTSPYDIIFDSSGNLYTTNYSSNNVSKVTPAGVSTILGTTGANPQGIAMDSAGNIYTANRGSNNISKITPAGVSTVLATVGSLPETVAVDTYGNVYSTGGTGIVKITPAGVVTNFATIAQAPRSLKFDAYGNLYAVNTSNTYMISPSGVVSTLSSSITNGYNILPLSMGLFVADTGANQTKRFVATGFSGGIQDLSSNTSLPSTSTDNSILYQLLTASDQVNVALAVDSTISITSPTDISLGNIVGTGQSTLASSFATWNVKTNNTLGYALSWQSSSASMTNANSDTIAGYTPASSGTPETWNVAATDSEWGAHLASTSTTVNTTTWGALNTYAGGKWLNINNISPYTIATRNTETSITGDNEIVYFGGEIGASKLQPTGTYTTDVTMTATTL